MFENQHAVSWYINAIRLGRRGRVKISLGICGFSGGVAFIAVHGKRETWEDFKPLIIRDVFASVETGCEDARWCLNLKCRLNKAEYQGFKHYTVRSRQDLERLHERIEDARVMLDLKPLPLGEAEFYEEPPLTIMVKRNGEEKPRDQVEEKEAVG